MTTDPQSPASSFDLSGKVAIVTGSGRGIGLGIALRLHAAGASVMCNARGVATAEFAACAAENARLRYQVADVSTQRGALALVDAAMREFGRLDAVINNAGIQPAGPWAAAEGAHLDATLAANVNSVEWMMRAALPAFERNGGGAVVNIASVRAARPGSRMAHYAASKAAVVAMTRALAVELGPLGIRVNALSPGLVERPGLAESWPDGVARFKADAPLRRLGAPADIGDACVFLVSPAAQWITGAELVIDGGISLVR